MGRTKKQFEMSARQRVHIALLTNVLYNIARIPCAPSAHLRSHAARNADASALDSADDDDEADDGSGVRQMRM